MPWKTPGRKPDCQFWFSCSGIAAGAHRDEAGQVLVLGAEAVGDPAPHARADQPRFAAVHQQERRLVIRHVRVHRADDADVVDVLRGVGEQISLTSSPLLPYFLNLNGDGKAAPVRRSVRRFAVGSDLPAYFVERRLRVEGIDLRRPAVGEDVDDALRLGREVRLLGRERIEAVAALACAVSNPDSPISCVRPSRPMPTPVRVSSSRRVCGSMSRIGTSPSMLLERTQLPGR